MSRTTRKQNILVLAGACGAIAVSIVVTLYATGTLFGEANSERQDYRNVTFTDAVLTCRHQAENTYGDSIRNLVTDSHSSRFDDSEIVYKVFLQMDLYDSKRTAVTLHYINCFVRAANGRVRKFEVFEDVEELPSRQVDDTNMFGMPKKKD